MKETGGELALWGLARVVLAEEHCQGVEATIPVRLRNSDN